MMWADDQPTDKKPLSTGAELAGKARILSNKYLRGTNSIPQRPGRRCKA